jgi:outer membrane protein W
LQVYPLIAAMTFVTGLCTFQLTRNVFMNPDVRYISLHTSSSVKKKKQTNEFR